MSPPRQYSVHETDGLRSQSSFVAASLLSSENIQSLLTWQLEPTLNSKMGSIALLTTRFKQQGCIDRSGKLPVLRIPAESKNDLDARVKIAKEQPTSRKTEFSTAEVEDLVDTLGVSEDIDKWSYLDEHAFATIAFILSLTPPVR